MAARRSMGTLFRLAAMALAGVALAGVAFAGAAAAQSLDVAPPPSGVVPVPAPLGGEDPDNPLVPPAPPAPTGTTDPARSQTGAGDDGTHVEISHDIAKLPEPVRAMRARIMEAARSGDPERLRPLLGTGPGATRLSLAEVEGDPIAHLRAISGDAQGHEMLAILLEVFEAGYVRFDAGTQNELYVWPYFFALPLDELTPEQRVELFKLVTAGDYEEMRMFGAYIFFRAAITPQGRWLFFVAGD